MYGIRWKVVARFLPALLLASGFVAVYMGMPPLWQLRDPSLGLHVPLVSVPPGTTSDVWSSVPGFLHLLIASFQVVLLVELARMVWSANGSLTPGRFLLATLYEAALIIDTFRLWGRDWLVWALHELRFRELCEPSEACYPSSGATPWPSLVCLVVLLTVSLLDLRRGPSTVAVASTT
jgi:hypothetical protein